MLKGAQKRMVVVKTQDSRIFEEAYFVIRTGTSASGDDMVGEANRIIDASFEKRRERTNKSRISAAVSVLLFIGGALLGSGITLVAAILA